MDPAEDRLLSVGAAAGIIGVAPATVRSWERRYGIGPSDQSVGGHRRYTPEDVDRLRAMHDLMLAGMGGAEAARVAYRPGAVASTADLMPLPVKHGKRALPRGLELPDRASAAAFTLARHVGRLDADAMTGFLSDCLIRTGVTSTWDEVVLPVLDAAGSAWVREGTDIDTEHALVESVVAALAVYRRFLPRPAPGPPVVLACTSADVHTLALHGVAGALAEKRTPVLLLGARVPIRAAVSAMARSRARALFLWRQYTGPDPEDAQLLRFLTTAPAGHVLVGGPGWDDVDLPSTRLRVRTLTEATERLTQSATP